TKLEGGMVGARRPGDPAGGGVRLDGRDRDDIIVLKPGERGNRVAGAADGSDDTKVVKKSPEKPKDKADLDPKKIWQDALTKGVENPGIIIGCADYLAEIGRFDHAAEFLKANLRNGIYNRPWVYDALAIALENSGASPDEINRVKVSLVDLEPMDAQGFM